ncbi:MAG: hypothetical protein J5621_04785, partial [Paludibacteraceae bacterium]|nr:hypothetical protein [Paludibacteraceae bacterium]
MKQLYAIMIMMTLLLSSVCSWAQEVVSVDSILADTDSVTDPEWYVAPIHYDSVIAHHAQHRVKAAAACPIDSILTYDIDS